MFHTVSYTLSHRINPKRHLIAVAHLVIRTVSLINGVCETRDHRGGQYVKNPQQKSRPTTRWRLARFLGGRDGRLSEKKKKRREI